MSSAPPAEDANATQSAAPRDAPAAPVPHAPAREALQALAPDWPRLSALLDEALLLEPARRDGWLQALPAEHAPLRDTLAKLLAVRTGIETGDFLAALPRVDEAAGTPDAGTASPGEIVGPYRLVREIGEGGMGSVWLAERVDGGLKRPVALKLPRLAWARGLAERMARERDILATLEHPNIARLYDAGVDALGRPWLALEVVEGRPIDEHATGQALDVRARVELLLQACEAVAYAHGRLVIHRDLKPSNMLVTASGQLKLLDFGIAKLAQGDGPVAATALTELAGRAFTPDYASPEQRRGEPLGTASDVYSLGVVAHELLTGRRPVPLADPAAGRDGPAAAAERPTASAVAGARGDAAGRAAAAALRGDLDAVLAKALAPAPAARYASVDALGEDLRRVLAGEPVSARRVTGWERAARRAWRHRVPLAAAAAVLAVLGVGLGLGTTTLVLLLAGAGSAVALDQARRARRGRAEAEAAARRAEHVRDGLLQVFALGGWQRGERSAHEITLKEALDHARERAAATLTHQPRDQAELFDALADVYEQLDLPDENFELLGQALAALDRAAALVPEDPAVRPRWLRLTQRRLTASFMHQRLDGFEPLLERYEAALHAESRAVGEADGAARAAALYLRARFEQQQGRAGFAATAERLAAAEALFARHAPADPLRQHALSLAVQAAVAAERWDEGERLAGTQIDLARRAPDSAAAIGNAYSVRGVLRLRAGRHAAAREDLLAAREDYLAHAGAEHMLTAQNEVFLGHAMVGCGAVEPGLATARAGVAAIERLRGREIKLAQSLDRLAAAELLAGEPAAALESASAALALWRERPPPSPPLWSAESLVLAAQALRLLGRGAEADARLAELDAAFAAAGVAAVPPRLIGLRAAAGPSGASTAATVGFTAPPAASPPPAPAAPAGR